MVQNVEMGIKGKLWRVVKSLYANNRSCVFLEDKTSEFFPLIKGLPRVAHCRPHCF